MDIVRNINISGIRKNGSCKIPFESIVDPIRLYSIGHDIAKQNEIIVSILFISILLIFY